MSKIDKLQILGIRSFDNQRAETIQFFSPLTLVVGFNGSGKTTIIECLKYVLTGIQPPNSKIGGAFVHDPKLVGEREVMAQVKLAFTAATGARLVATRSLQLTVKKLTRSLKTLEGQLLLRKDGERTSISTRVAELDIILPQYLGVSTAVIDNVIFCHQDESLWPLSDSSTLKKKFDEIFEAQKYTKAITNIKDIRKKHNEELAKYKILEQHAKEDKERALKAEKKSVQLQTEIEQFRSQIESLDGKINQARELASKARQQEEQYNKIIGRLEGKRIEARGKESIIADLELNLKEVPESDAWLESTLQQFDARQQELEKDLRVKQDKYIVSQDQSKWFREQLNAKLADRGKYEHERDEHGRLLIKRREMIGEAAVKHQIRGYDDLGDENLCTEFVYKIRKTHKDQVAAQERTKKTHDSEKREAQTLINKLTERRAAIRESKDSIKRQISNNDREASEFQRKADTIKADEGSKAVSESRMEDLHLKIQAARSSAQSSDLEKRLHDANLEARVNEDYTTRLNDELIQATKRAGETAKLSHLKQELNERQKSLQTMLSAHSDRIGRLLNQDWDASTIFEVHQRVIASARSDTMSAEGNREAVSREIEQFNFRQKSSRDELTNKNDELEQHIANIRRAIDTDPSEYEETLESLKSSVDFARSETQGFEGLEGYIQRVLDSLNADKPACRTCGRGFKSGTDPFLAQTKKRMENLLKQSAEALEQSNIKAAEADYQKALEAGVSYESWKKLTLTDIPTIENELESLTQKKEALLARIEKHDIIVNLRRQEQQEVESISKTINSISQCQADIISLNVQVEQLVSKQSQVSGGRTLDDMQEELATTTQKAHGLKELITRLTTEQQRSTSDLSSLQLDLRDSQAELSQISFDLEKKASLMARVTEFRTMNYKQREALEKADDDIGNLDPQITSAQAKYEDIVERGDQREQEMSTTSRVLGESLNSLSLLNDQITSYIERGGENQLARVVREIKNMEEENQIIQTEQGRLTREMNTINDQIKDSESTRRQYSDNLRYRREIRALEVLRTEIDELSTQNAEDDRDRLSAESAKHDRERSHLSAQQFGLMGEMRSKDAQLGELLADYQTDFQDAPKRYREAHIRVETTKAAVEDLGRYGSALDRAIMKFHGLKMEEVNSIIEELWRKTYQGTDVDSILIRADNESGRGNRSYNYRVVMVKQDTEMDMRGRCSAGQKVLASIIIRLALAECFSANCGLITLDEPTTNLDQDNIRSLAVALHDIIKARQQQSNFQLIVITHDEEFLRAMKCGEFADYYYRVSRNEKTNSIIEKNNISEVL